jgi:hypothetical protein
MVVEEDHDLCPKIAILASQVTSPEPPKGSWIVTPTTKVGPIALYRTPLERNHGIIKEDSMAKTSFRSAYHFRPGCLQLSGAITSKSNQSTESYDMFSKVDAKFSRETEPVKMSGMLSREEHKTLYALEPKPQRNPIKHALDQFGYAHYRTDRDFNIPDLHQKILAKREDKSIFGFEKFLPRQYRQSIYSQNDGIEDSCIVDKEKSYAGRDNFTFIHDAKPLQFKYEKEVNPEDLNNSQELYMKVIKSKESIDYLKKVMEKRGVLKEAKNPLKGTRFE